VRVLIFLSRCGPSSTRRNIRRCFQSYWYCIGGSICAHGRYMLMLQFL